MEIAGGCFVRVSTSVKSVVISVWTVVAVVPASAVSVVMSMLPVSTRDRVDYNKPVLL